MSFEMLKHYMPRGIYGRAALILLLPVVILQLVVTVIFAQRHFEGVTHQMTDTVLRELALVLDVTNAAPTAAQAQLERTHRTRASGTITLAASSSSGWQNRWRVLSLSILWRGARSKSLRTADMV